MFKFLLSMATILIFIGCQSGSRRDHMKPKGLIGGDLAMSTERIARICRKDTDCVGFKHPCGHYIPVLKWEYEDFSHDWKEKFGDTKFDCSRFDKGGAIMCDAGACVNRKTI